MFVLREVLANRREPARLFFVVALRKGVCDRLVTVGYLTA